MKGRYTLLVEGCDTETYLHESILLILTVMIKANDRAELTRD